MEWLNITVLCWNVCLFVSLAASCSDIGYFCWIWKKTGKCVSSSEYAVNKCKKTCNFCPVPTEIPATSITVSSTITPTSSISAVSTPAPTPECHFEHLPISRDRFSDKQLQGHVIWHQYVLSEVMCEDLCLRVPRCVAYNYQYSVETGVKEKFCELMNEVAVVKDRPGYSFRLFERERARKNLLGSCMSDT